MQLYQFKNRAIILDYVWGCHGVFLASVLNNLIYNNTEIEYGNLNNSHGRKLVIYYNADYQPGFDVSNINLDISKFGNSNLPIFVHMHYRHNNLVGIENFKRISLNVSVNSWYRHFVNTWFNPICQDDGISAKSEEFFITNFFRLCSSNIGYEYYLPTIFPSNVDDLPNHKFTRESVIDVLMRQLYQLHHNTYDIANAHCYSGNNSTTYGRDIDLNELYEFNSFLQVITDIKNIFDLQFEVNEEYLLAEWELLMSKQYDINMDAIQQEDVDSLHPIHAAYSRFLKRCNTLRNDNVQRIG